MIRATLVAVCVLLLIAACYGASFEAGDNDVADLSGNYSVPSAESSNEAGIGTVFLKI